MVGRNGGICVVAVLCADDGGEKSLAFIWGGRRAVGGSLFGVLCVCVCAVGDAAAGQLVREVFDRAVAGFAVAVVAGRVGWREHPSDTVGVEERSGVSARNT